MTAEITSPIRHDATHDADFVIQGIPDTRIFCCSNYLALALTEKEIRQIVEQLSDWLRAK